MSNWLEVRVPFFRAVWRRVVVFAICALWALVEFAGGSLFWGILFGAAAIYLGWAFFLAFEGGPES